MKSAINLEPPRLQNPNDPYMVGAQLQTAVSPRDGQCVLLGWDESSQAAHLVPKGEIGWFQVEAMHKYVPHTTLLGTAAIHDKRNAITLRSDIHKAMDERKFAFVPKDRRWVPHFLRPSRC